MKLGCLPVFITFAFICPCIHSISQEYIVKRTKYGKIKGYINDIKDVGKVERYLGVPYARPPIDQYRFEHAEEPIPWGDEIIETTRLPPACYQRYGINGYLDQHYPNFRRQSEDCLYINIYVPVHQRTLRKNVLFHIHGGSNGYGMGSMLHGDVLAVKADVIVVTFNYRLGVFGFFGSNSKIFPGNYGMTDQVKALHWVQENIHYFGGDRNKVTITGHSAGGCDVGLHIISPLSKGLFRYAVMMSGSPLAYWCVEENTTLIDENFSDFANATGCLDVTNDVSTIKDCLKNVDSKKLNNNGAKSSDRYFQFGVNIGDEFLPDDPRYLLKSGQLNGDSYMIGLTSLEGSWAANIVKTHDTGELIKKNLFFTPLPKEFDTYNIDILEKVYFSDAKANNSEDAAKRIGHMIGDFVFNIPAINVADAIANHGETIYFYRFDHSSDNYTGSESGVPHGQDLFYLFGSPFIGHHILDYNDEDRIVSNSYIKMFSSFVEQGKPSVQESDVSIPTYTSSEKYFFRLNSFNGQVYVTIDRNYREKEVLYWNKCLDTILQGPNYGVCFSSGDSNRVHYLLVISVIALFLK